MNEPHRYDTAEAVAKPRGGSSAASSAGRPESNIYANSEDIAANRRARSPGREAPYVTVDLRNRHRDGALAAGPAKGTRPSHDGTQANQPQAQGQRKAKRRSTVGWGPGPLDLSGDEALNLDEEGTRYPAGVRTGQLMTAREIRQFPAMLSPHPAGEGGGGLSPGTGHAKFVLTTHPLYLGIRVLKWWMLPIF